MSAEKNSQKNRKNVTKRAKKKKRATVKDGVAHVHATFNNTIVTFTDIQGNTLSQSSAGELGYKGARKSTPLAGKQAAHQAAQKAKEYGLENVEVAFNGPGPCREYVVKALRGSDLQLNITALSDITPIPHNGCKPRKKRRV